MISARGGGVSFSAGTNATSMAAASAGANAARAPGGDLEIGDFVDLGIADADTYVLTLLATADGGPQVIVADVARGPFSFRIERPERARLSVVAASEHLPVGFQGKLVVVGARGSDRAVSWPLKFVLPLGVDKFAHRIDVTVPPLETAESAWFRGVGLFLNPIMENEVFASTGVVGTAQPIFAFVDKMYGEFFRESEELLSQPTKEAARDRFPAFKSKWSDMIEGWRMLSGVFKSRAPQEKKRVAVMLVSSQAQPLNIISTRLYVMDSMFGRGADLRDIIPAKTVDGVDLGGRKVIVPRSKFEIADILLAVLKGEGDTVTWNLDGSVNIQHAKGWRTNYPALDYLHDLSWPDGLAIPDVVDFLSVLGWQMTFEQSGGDNPVVKIDFGEII